MSEESVKSAVSERTKTGLEILEAAVLLGVLGDALLRATPWGLNVFLFALTLGAALIGLTLRRKHEFWNAQAASLHGALIFFGAMFVWRDSAELKLLNALAIFAILAILTLPALGIKSHVAGIFQYFYAALWTGLCAVFAPLVLVFGDVKWKTIPQNGWTRHLVSVLRGLAVAVPLLLVFGALFMAADAAFEGIVRQTFRINPDIVFTHLLLIGFVSWISAGYLRASLVEPFSHEKTAAAKSAEIKTPILSITAPEKAENEKENALESKPPAKEQTKSRDWRKFDNSVLPPAFTLGAIEVSIVLGLINLLFLSFVVVQIPYLFGGMSWLQSTPDFKLAEYARRGFGELVAVAALVLPILLLSHWLLRRDKPQNEKIYRVLAGIQIALLFVIMTSAAQRLLLYTGSLGYGLTAQRLYPMAFMIWLALVFIVFALTVLRSARDRFAWGALWSALFVLATLHVFNPDDFIVRTNARLMRERGRSFDTGYVSELSDDAVPALLDALPALNFEQQCVIKNKIARRYASATEENDFRTWNWSRYAAREKIARSGENFDTSDCSPQARRVESESVE